VLLNLPLFNHLCVCARVCARLHAGLKRLLFLVCCVSLPEQVATETSNIRLAVKLTEQIVSELAVREMEADMTQGTSRSTRGWLLVVEMAPTVAQPTHVRELSKEAKLNSEKTK